MDSLKLPLTSDDSKLLTGKSNSMPIKDQLANLMKMHKRSASTATASSYGNPEKYANEAEILDWSVAPLTDKHV